MACTKAAAGVAARWAAQKGEAQRALWEHPVGAAPGAGTWHRKARGAAPAAAVTWTECDEFLLLLSRRKWK